MRLLVEEIWKKTRKKEKLSGFLVLIWFILRLMSHLYGFALQLRNFFWRFRKIPSFNHLNIPVVSVGNLTVGGSGKSVFVAWLIDHAGFRDPAVLSRGYKSLVLKKQKTFVVSTRKKIFGTGSFVGDEPLEIAEKGVAVAIGKNRFKAASDLIIALGQELPDVFILDDGYQTMSIKKACNILLVDARAPLENGFLFPASPLREQDYHRADCIILTHADQALGSLVDIKKKYFPDFLPQNIFAGRHAFVGLYDALGFFYELPENSDVILCAGIAKPDNLKQTIESIGLVIDQCITYQDHHIYTIADIKNIIKIFQNKKNRYLLTTEKDWSKLREFDYFFKQHEITCLRVKIAFEFLTPQEYDHFKDFFRKCLRQG